VRRAVLGGCAAGLATGWNVANIGAIPSHLARSYGVGLAVVGLFTTALFVTHLAMQIPGGRAADRFGARRAALVVGVCGFAVLLSAPPEPRRVLAERELDVPAGILRDRRLYRLAVLYAASLGLSLVVGNWVVELLHRNADVAKGTAGAVGALTLLLGVVTRPLGGWILRERAESMRAAVGLSLAAGAVGTALLAVAEPLGVAVLGAVLIGLAAGIPFAPAFTGAALARPDAPAAAVGLVNGAASLVAIAGAPLLGLTFSRPGDGRIGFVVVAVLWVVALALLPAEHDLGVRR
jgi:MFS family permease